MGRLSKSINSPINNKGKKRYHKGFYEIRNLQKYVGDPTKCIYESSWELKFMMFLDHNEDIVKWGSEAITIPYQDESGHFHRYYPDMYYELKDKRNPNNYVRVVAEIKPFVETQNPEQPKKFSQKALESYEYRLKTYQKNLYKWLKAKEWCQHNGLVFIIITEKQLEKYKIL